MLLKILKADIPKHAYSRKKYLAPDGVVKIWSLFIFFYLGFLSRTLTIHRTEGEGVGFLTPPNHFYPLQTLRR